MNKIFVDASFFVALLKRDDPNHNNATRVVEKLVDKSFLYTNFIAVGEAATVVSQRVGKKQANELVRSFEVGDYKEIQVDSEIITDASNIFLNQKSKNFPYFDALHASCMKKEGINRMLGFDKHFKKLGFTLL